MAREIGSKINDAVKSTQEQGVFSKILEHYKRAFQLEAKGAQSYTQGKAYYNDYAKAVKLADQMHSEIESMNLEQKKIIADLYARYAQSIVNFDSPELLLAHEAIEKSLKLDPENLVAKSVYQTLNFEEDLEQQPGFSK